MDRYEESQDVDITILPENEQPRHTSDCSDILPNFQLLDGRGAVQNSTDSTDRTIEGFVALKITYDHVFRKQREKTRLLQQKNQQLATEIQLLKKERKDSRYHSAVEQNVSNLEGLTQWWSDQEPGPNLKDDNCTPNEASLSVNTFSPSSATLQKLVSYYQLMNLIKCHRSESGVNRKDKLEREKSQDEDMYGPEGTLGEEEFSPYNLKRLCMKLMKLQEFPAKYQSMMEHISTSLGSSSVDDTVSTSTCISAQSGLTTGGRSSCFVGIHNIKLPPTNLSKQALQGRDDSINQPVMYYEESPVTRNDIEVSHRQDGNNTYPLLTEGSLSFEQACGPPTHVDVIKINKESSVPDLYCGKSCSSVPSVNSTPDEVKCIDEKENECEEDIIGEHECVAVPQVLISKQLHPATHENTEIKNSQGSECTLLHKKSPYMPGSDSVHDQLVTAHSSLHFGAEGVPKVECPVCLQNFPTDTSEETVTTHVNLHFDEQLKNSHSFEILNNQSLH